METSDSECFESADEDFQSDDEDTTTVRVNKPDEMPQKNVAKDSIKGTQKKLDNLTLEDAIDNVSLPHVDTNSNTNTIDKTSKTLEVDDCQKDLVQEKENVVVKNLDNINKNEVEETEHRGAKSKKTTQKVGTKEPKTKLGSKLGNKLVKQEYESKVQEKLDHKHSEITEHEKFSTTEQNVIQNQKNLWEDDESKLQSQEPKEVSKSEENLWDDEELDWGKENLLNVKNEDVKSSATQKSNKPQKEVNDENLWDDDDDWEPIPNQNTTENKNSNTGTMNYTNSSVNSNSDSNSWGSWGNWGVSSILSTATHSVSTLTSQVSQGLSTVLETNLSIPDPEELARINKTEREKVKTIDREEDTSELEDDQSNTPLGFGLGNLVSGVSHLTKLVETTSTKVISGGLDTLETIGKKTMEVLQEGDPGFKKKRAFLKLDQNRPVLSQVLREAKEKSEEENKILENKHYSKKAKNYETLFDDHQGLMHLEALEMLSRQCDIKLQTLLESATSDSLIEMQETMDQVKELCELPDEEEDEQITIPEIKEKLESAVSEINIPISYEGLICTWDETENWLNNLKLNVCDERELHQQAIETLAQLTAIAVEQFHKSGELLLIKDHRSTADEADSLVQLTTALTAFIGIVAGKFSEKLNAKASDLKNKEMINGLITNVFFEAANSSSYIQDAFQLLIPVLQVGAV